MIKYAFENLDGCLKLKTSIELGKVDNIINLNNKQSKFYKKVLRKNKLKNIRKDGV